MAVYAQLHAQARRGTCEYAGIVIFNRGKNKRRHDPDTVLGRFLADGSRREQAEKQVKRVIFHRWKVVFLCFCASVFLCFCAFVFLCLRVLVPPCFGASVFWYFCVFVLVVALKHKNTEAQKHGGTKTRKHKNTEALYFRPQLSACCIPALRAGYRTTSRGIPENRAGCCARRPRWRRAGYCRARGFATFRFGGKG